jgi:hypothetical protein
VDGAITFEGEGITQTGTVFNFRGGVAKLEGQYGIITTTNGEIVTVSLPTPANAADQFLRSDGSNVFWSTDRFPLPSVGTNFVNFNSNNDNVQEWVVSNAVSNVVIYAWGGGGASQFINFSSAGGYSEVWYEVTAGETLKVVVANSGHFGTSVTPFSGWPGGGTNSASTYNFGGGFSGVYRNGTNWNDPSAEYLLIAGGGAGAAGNVSGTSGGGGGGLSGQDAASGVNAAKGGTQIAGGLGWNSQTNNFAGTRFFGGGGAGANIHAGGGGYYGGGAGTNTAGFLGGAGGSGYVGINALYGFTIQASRGGLVPYSDNPYYLTGRAATSQTTVLVPGQVTIRW